MRSLIKSTTDAIVKPVVVSKVDDAVEMMVSISVSVSL